MPKNILLVEPNYKTKFPPLGLMKISSYHKALGDNVQFVKGISQKVAYEYWDRIYVTTLFTYNWKVTVDTILHYKKLVRGDLSRLLVGGIMSSLEPEALWQETGIVPKTGVLSYPNALDDDNDLIVDEMLPDYELFDGIQHNYTLIDDSYFGYSTRGCVHKCDFCGVHRLEPKFIEYRGLKPYIQAIDTKYGSKCHLILFDNNILASKKFDNVISDILDLGFEKGAKFGPTRKMRRLDFNQGTDARLMTEHHVKLLAKTAINPLRIAFDSIRYKDLYIKKVKLAADYGITKLSNYILYNHDDTPEDFWERLKINIDLNSNYGLKIYSFPMKYIPLNAKDRTYVDEKNWNWYFVRNVQRILNVMKGSVMTGEEFFFRAFGANPDEFRTILHMPERILMFRSKSPQSEEIDWLKKFNALVESERTELIALLSNNRSKANLQKAYVKLTSLKMKEIFAYYVPEPAATPLFDMLEGATS
ncbi:MAG: cobalamin-binding domain-containing protein [Candidatus Electrothrix sp. ATG1]|nr:cobalamin-binding domain-containing protein [Candidatus Electrothrix sp. ATG1]